MLFRSLHVREEKITSFQNDTFEKNIVNAPLNIIDFEMIMKIEYLDGYEKNRFTNEVMINRPIWKLMNLEDFNKFNSGKEVLCRLSSYSNKALNVTKNDDLEASIYDKYFILQTVRRTVNVSRNIPLNGLIRNSFDTIRNNFTNLRMRPSIQIPNNIREPFTSLFEVSGLREDQKQNVINPIRNMTIKDMINTDALKISNKTLKSKNDIPASAQIAVDVLSLDIMSGSNHTSVKNSNPIPSVRLRNVAYNISRNRRNNSLDSNRVRGI